MSDEELKRYFSDLPVPEPREQAKEEALAAARAEFARAQSEKNLQGNPETRRPMVSNNHLWRRFMTSISPKNKAAVAFASLALVAVGVGVLSQYEPPLKQEGNFENVAGQLPAPSMQVSRPSLLPEHTKQGTADSTTTPSVAEEMTPPPPPSVSKAIKESGNATGAIQLSPPAPMVQQYGRGSSEMAKRSLSIPQAPAEQPASGAIGAAGVSADAMIAPAPMPEPYPYYQPQPQANDRYAEYETSPQKLVREEPVSTFSIDVDTASYSAVRRMLNDGQLPPAEAIRVEELVNYFRYDYALPENREQPFKPTVAVYPTPWNKNTKLMHIGIKGFDVPQTTRPRANLVFLIDTSGSMQGADRLELAKKSFRLLLDTLKPNDVVSIVTYAGDSSIALEPTKVSNRATIEQAIDALGAGGSTAGAQGITDAYRLAQQHFDKEGVNRILIATDGDFNVGLSSPDELQRLVEQKRKSGVFLSVLGFGMGNYHDALMQSLAQNGNGQAAYIDSLNEARKVLLEEASSAIFPIAKDVKIQVEFNPDRVAEYRLLGYETRALKREDFNNDAVDAGDIGSGHTVTAIYEITPVGSESRRVDDLRYGSEKKAVPVPSSKGDSGEYAFVKLRYKLPNGNSSRLIEQPVTEANVLSSIGDAPRDLRFAAAVAGFGEKLRHDPRAEIDYPTLIKLAQSGKGDDEFGHRAEFIRLMRLAESLDR